MRMNHKFLEKEHFETHISVAQFNLKALDSCGNNRIPVFSLGLFNICITIKKLWKFGPDLSSKLQGNVERNSLDTVRQWYSMETYIPFVKRGSDEISHENRYDLGRWMLCFRASVFRKQPITIKPLFEVVVRLAWDVFVEALSPGFNDWLDY